MLVSRKDFFGRTNFFSMSSFQLLLNETFFMDCSKWNTAASLFAGRYFSKKKLFVVVGSLLYNQ